VDRHIGDDDEVAVDRGELLHDAAVLPRHDAARDGERPVEPARHQHAAVGLGVEPQIVRVRELRVFLKLEGRRVAVRGRHLKARKIPGRHAERDEGRIVSRGEVPPALAQLPRLPFAQLAVALREQDPADILHRVIAAGALSDEFQQLRRRFVFQDTHSLFSGFVFSVIPCFPAAHQVGLSSGPRTWYDRGDIL
jgi:hypothetical protein